MFLRVPTNFMNASLNYTPLGAVRAARGMEGPKGTERKNFTKDERNRLYLQSIVGTTLMGAAANWSSQDGEFEITSTGPSNFKQQDQLKASGWRPYSIRIGKTWVSYKDTPLLIPLAIAGHVADAVRYQKASSDLILEDKVLNAVMQAPAVIFDTSMLTGMGQLMDYLQGNADPKSLANFLGKIPANIAIPYSSLLSQIDRTFDSKVYDSNVLQASVPFARREGTVRTDVQGRAINRPPTDRFVGVETNDPVDKMLRSKNVFLPEVGKDIKIGNRVLTDKERDTYRRMSGQRTRLMLQARLPYLNTMNQEQVQKEVNRISSQEREKVLSAIKRSLVTTPQ